MTEPDTTEACAECGAAAGVPCAPDCWVREEANQPVLRGVVTPRGDNDDAFCTECFTWYNSRDLKQLNRHAH